MSQLTNYAENKLADFLRGQALSLPSSWYIAPLSAASDSAVTEITGAGLARAAVARSLANFAGTQGDTTTLASTGSSHATSNNGVVSLGTATGGDTLTALGFFDASSAGNCWFVWRLETPLTFGSGDPISFAISQIKFTLGLTGGMSNYLSNKLIDLLFRGQSFSMPSSIWHALYTAAPNNAGGGTEVGGGVGYARAELVISLTNLCGTQGAGTTVASTGTSGRIANNIAVAHPDPSGAWGVCTHGGWKDASSGGNLLFWGELGSPVTPVEGSVGPNFAPDTAEFIFA